jgi:hydroxymethylpyrimidine pyrophosphatase-like HAD family hydrolase
MNHPIVLAIDLDGTLLHPEPAEISVWGRTRHQYLSLGAANLLAEVSKLIPIVIATARHAQTVEDLVQQLPEVDFCGFVCENGLVHRSTLRALNPVGRDWSGIIEQLPEWERIHGYEQCLGLIPPKTIGDPHAILKKALFDTGKQGYVYVDGHKIFVYPTRPDKSRGIKALGYVSFIAAGNDLNDIEMLSEAQYTATLSSAHPKVRTLVEDREGYCAPLDSHAGTTDLLDHIRSKSEEFRDFVLHHSGLKTGSASAMHIA